MNPQRLLRITAAGAFLWALPAVLGAAPRVTDGHVVVRVPVPAVAPSAKVEAVRLAPQAAGGNMSRVVPSARPVLAESPRVVATSGSSGPNVPAGATRSVSPQGLK